MPTGRAFTTQTSISIGRGFNSSATIRNGQCTPVKSDSGEPGVNHTQSLPRQTERFKLHPLLADWA